MALIRPLKLRSEKVAVRQTRASHDPIAFVLVDTKVFHLDEPYSYLIPEAVSDRITVGSLVKIPFGRTTTEGVVLGRTSDGSTAGLKFIESLISDIAPMGKGQIHLTHDVAKRYGVPQWDVMRLALPAYVASGEKRAKVENLPKIETAGSIDRFALTLLPGSSLVDQVQLYAARKSEHKTLVVVPDQKTLDKFEGIADILLSGTLPKSDKYQKYLEANCLQSGLVVGLRSSVFLELNPGDQLVVVSDSDANLYERHTPTYNVRDVALLRAVDASLCFISPSHSLEIERLIEIGYLEERSAGERNRKVLNESSTNLHAVVSEGLKKGNVLLVHANAGYVNSFLCNHCRNMATCSCGERLILQRDGKGTQCPMCATKSESWSCFYCQRSIPQSLSQGVLKRAEDYGRSFPNTRVVVSSSDGALTTLPEEKVLVISTPGMEPDGDYAAVCLLDGEQIFGRTGLRSDESGELHWASAANKVSEGGTVFISLPLEHPVTQAFTRGSFKLRHRSELASRLSAKLPPEFRLISIEGSVKDLSSVLSFLETDTSEMEIVTIGPIEIGKDLSRLLVKYPVSMGNSVVRKVHEMNRIRSLQALTVLRVSVDPYEFI